MLREDLTFSDFELRPEVLQGITQYGFEHPTDIQAELIPAVLKGKDVLGQARTGTGKSAAFGLPLIQRCDQGRPGQALVLAPTRELALQLAKELGELAKFSGIGVVSIIGGASSRDQKEAYERGGEIIVGTPGRVMDLHKRHMISLKAIRFTVLDEVDRMLDIGFRDEIRDILSRCPRDRQTIFVSATMEDDIERLAMRFMADDMERITTVSGSLTVAQVDQTMLPVAPWDKRPLLLHLLRNEKPDTVLVFCRTKMTVSRLIEYLRDKHISARGLHGNMPQVKRNKVMDALRAKQINILVASDLAARGLDVDHITHVVNYDLPEDPEVYIHRIGRTARAGRRGTAWSFVTPDQGALLTAIEKLAGAEIAQKEYPGFEPGPIPEGRESEAKQEKTEPKSFAAGIAERAHGGVELGGISEEEKARLFPGGVVPKGPPARRGLGGKFRKRR